jgi:uncharacterized protein YecT (DUF1311 family)
VSGLRSYFFVGSAVLSQLLFSGTASRLHAQNEKTPIEVCGNLDTQGEMNDCAAGEAKRADDALNVTYRDLLSKIRKDKTATERVIAAEKAWIAYRDAELAAIWPVPQGENPQLLYGSVHPLCYYDELATMTRERVKTLKELMRYDEGDVCGSGLAPASRGSTSPPCSTNVAKSN